MSSEIRKWRLVPDLVRPSRGAQLDSRQAFQASVLWSPTGKYWIPAWAEISRSHGLRFHVDPYSSIAYYPNEYCDAERRFLEPWIWENRKSGLRVVKPDFPITVLCSGGVAHFNVQPDGSAWRCILERQLGVNPLGKVFDPGFELLSSSWQCAESWQCPACDGDNTHLLSRCSGD